MFGGFPEERGVGVTEVFFLSTSDSYSYRGSYFGTSFLNETRFISTAGFLKRMHFSDKSRDAVSRRAHVQMAACLLRNRFNLAFKIQMCIAVQMRFAACAGTIYFAVQIPALVFLSTAGVGHSCRRTLNCLHVVANWAFWWRYG